MKRALLFLAAGIAAVSIAVICPPSVMCKQHLVEAENAGKEETSDGRCFCVYQHVVESTGEVHTFKTLC
jgi:hypothetical protein